MPKTLLVIDDSQTIQEAVQHALTGEDWHVVVATNAEEATASMQAQQADAILCDVAPGDADGYELCRDIGSSPEGAGVPVVLMGANVNATVALTVGASATLPKPFEAEQLCTALAEILDQGDFAFDFEEVAAPAEDAAALEAEVPMEELELAPVSAADADADLAEVEIIDLSGDDEFAELELLDDLQPIEPIAAPSAAPDMDLAWPAAQSVGAAADLAGDSADVLATAEDSFDLEALDLAADVSVETDAPTPPPEIDEAPAAATALDQILTSAEEETAESMEAAAPMELEDLLSDSAVTAETAAPPVGEDTQADLGEAALDLSALDLAAETPATEDEVLGEATTAVPAEESTPAETDSGAGEDWDTLPLADVDEGLDTVLTEMEPEAPSTAISAAEQEPAPVLDDGEWNLDLTAVEAEVGAAADQTADESPPPEAATGELPAAGLDTEPFPAVPLEATEELPADGDADLSPAATGVDPADLAADTGAAPDTPIAAVDEPLPATATAALQPDALAAAVADQAGQAVRESLHSSLSAENLAPVIEAAVAKVAWEVVPQLAERLIRETIEKLQEPPGG